MLTAFVNHSYYLLPFCCFLLLPFGRPPVRPHLLSCALEYSSARVRPPREPVSRKYFMADSGILMLFTIFAS